MNDISSFFSQVATELASAGLIPLVIAQAAVILAYAVFTLAGFGSALVSSSPLAMTMPVGRVVPLLALLDLSGSSLRGWRARQAVDWVAFRQLFPGMLAGQLLGVWLLAGIPPKPIAVILGAFVICQSVRGGLRKSSPQGQSVFPAFAHGLFGGVLGGLFGSGGFVYAAYLERHLQSREQFRATQALLIALSTGWRLVLCLAIGLLDLRLLATALAFAPAMAIGVYLGHRIDLRMSRAQLFQLLNGLLIASSASLIVRFAF